MPTDSETDTHDLQLQQELQRFATRFTDRVTQAMEILERSSQPRVRDDALRGALRYVSSAMEIATGPAAEINLLDMFVFVRLGRAVVERHWIPEVYGSEGTALLESFTRSDVEISEIVERVLGAGRRAQLAAIVDAWLTENPGQIRVEGVRLADFSAAAGSAAAGRALQARGLLSSVKTATRAANEMMLISDRVMFLVHRLPFLWRLQARLGAREIIEDTVPIPQIVARARRIARKGALVAGVLGSGALAVWWVNKARSR